ncbi:SMP-30/gluconolactonase/LRE family protein [Cytophagaceae bacterium YF14B1]|uniref:SMP-30/gluconolactonase/LRE family protein n=1 Tax=Xanthocytophaga flava TaxID=3048013 RepID=A0AAE3U7L8_9BACT|nr:IPT/TIG domain-containing protein [Xanthocytophaga flavus]MDJ1482566.1 SMP-30/gluconolactonase/LRE family protein [Xanthocytophaga flavus]
MHKILLFLTVFIISQNLFCQTKDFQLKKVIGTPVHFPQDISIDENMDMYVLELSYPYIQKFDSAGQFKTKIYLEDPSLAETKYVSTYASSLVVDSQGNINILSSGFFYKYSQSGTMLMKIALDTGHFGNPDGFCIDKKGNIYIACTGNDKIQKFDSQGRFLLEIGRSGSAEGEMKQPGSLVVDDQENIYVTDYGNHRIQKFGKNGNFLKAFGKEGWGQGDFEQLGDIVFDHKGNLLISDVDRNIIQRIDTNGVFLEYLSTGSLDGTRIMIAVAKSGSIYISDRRHHGDATIIKCDTQGKFIRKFGHEGQILAVAYDKSNNLYVAKYGKIDIYTALGQYILSFPVKAHQIDGLAIGNRNDIYVVSNSESKIYKYNAQGQLISTFEDLGIPPGELKMFDGLTIDPDENLFLAYYRGRIHKISSTGKFMGVANYGQLWTLHGIASDTKGNIFTLDMNGHRIRKYDAKENLVAEFGPFDPNENPYVTEADISVDKYSNVYVAHHNPTYTQIYNSKGVLQQQVDLSSYLIAANKEGTLFAAVEYSQDAIFLYSSSDEVFNSIGNYIKGTVYHDINKNCKQDSAEAGIEGAVIIASPGPYYGVTDKSGNYTIKVDTGSYTIEQMLPTAQGKLVSHTCNQSTQTSHLTKDKSIDEGNNFGNSISLTPYLTSSVSSDRRRRCFTNQTVVSYSNSGFAVAQDVKVYIKLPVHVILKAASHPYVIDKDSNYIFSIGNLAANQSGAIRITDSVACVANIMGLTACTKAWITPVNSYTSPDGTSWDNSDIVLTGKCVENGRIQMVIKNIGQKAMADSAEFRILLNAQLSLRKNFMLAKGDSLVLKVPANGKTVRLEADQRPGHPRKSQTNLTIEGCIASVNDIVGKGFVDVLPQDDAEPEVSINCLMIRDSYDPNDKQVSPLGTVNDHFVPTGSELKYTIRFQNTGTDTAYTVTVIDTLSEHLDVSTLQMGATSHNYNLSIGGKGRPVLTWLFTTINLPDSTRDQKGSNGFLQFTIKPKGNLPEKTRIENYADIIFDYNEPVRTNSTTNVMYDIPPVISEQNKLNDKEVLFMRPTIVDFTPKQAQVGEQITIAGTGYKNLISDNIVHINGITATVLSATESELVVIIPGSVSAGKITVSTVAGTATSEAIFTPLLPVITSFTPENGFVGTTVKITGAYFQHTPANNSIKINGTLAVVSSASETELVFIIPQGATTGKLSVTTPTGTTLSASDFEVTQESEWEKGLVISPNPTDGKIWIDCSQSLAFIKSYEVFNSLGQRILLSTDSISTSTTMKEELNLTGNGAGLYLIVLETNKGKARRKIILK